MNRTILATVMCAAAALGMALNGWSAQITNTPAASKDTNGGWINLFDGKTLKGWKEADFHGKGPVIVTNGTILMKSGYMTGIKWTNGAALYSNFYELYLEGKRVEGSDFFSTVTFPVNTNFCSLVVGGWGGSLVGLSSLDGEDAANNTTTTTKEFVKDQWYPIRIQVRPSRIQAWIDGEKVVDVDISERRVGVRFEMEECIPMGVATWSTSGAVRDIRMRLLPPSER